MIVTCTYHHEHIGVEYCSSGMHALQCQTLRLDACVHTLYSNMPYVWDHRISLNLVHTCCSRNMVFYCLTRCTATQEGHLASQWLRQLCRLTTAFHTIKQKATGQHPWLERGTQDHDRLVNTEQGICVALLQPAAVTAAKTELACTLKVVDLWQRQTRRSTHHTSTNSFAASLLN